MLGSPLLNACGLHVARLIVAHLMMGLRIRLFGVMVPAPDRRAFARTGLIIKPDFLPPELFARIVAEAERYQGGVQEFQEGEAITRRAMFDDPASAPGPATRSLETWKPLARTMAMASGGAPAIWSIECVVHGAGDPQATLHSDTFHPTAKCWLYLTDVGPTEGPFMYVVGSNRLTWRRLVWEYRRSRIARDLDDGHSEHGSLRATSDDLIELGLAEPRAIAVKANTLVVANTYGFHKRSMAPAGAMRTAIMGYARDNPFLPVSLPPVGVAQGLLARGRQRYFRWLRRETEAGRIAGRRVYVGRLDR